MTSLIKKIQNTAFQNNLWTKGSKIILGVSGGPDSVCLLDVFSKLRKKYDLQLLIAHVNYGLRGKDSDRDEELVRKSAEKHGLEIEVSHPEFRRLNLRKISENELRNIRYAFFEKVRRKNHFDLIAVAHNLDDQVETYLMRIIRGAGLQGLVAMKYKTGNIIRPLLGISRKEILEYLKNNHLKFRIDKTNREIHFLRNKIRHRLLPELEKNYNPRVRKTIFNATASIAEDYSFLSELAEKKYHQNKELRVSRLLALHPALQRRILLRAISEKKAGLEEVTSAHIEEILKILRSTKKKPQFVIFKGLKIERKGDRMTILSLK